ncbi:MAG TPA: sn-glycerol-3-phosphate ABC transporter ATP-binding protein UgpC [Gemmatimonadales bacterium]|nr:sn-glycerol-3-phosphate ABC transporter ATP-binding protein UgpC [Gemmatimonadales bacterium]
MSRILGIGDSTTDPEESNVAGLRIENVSKRFGGVVAVDGVSLDVEDGELMVLVGPSGCGKSTLLRLIAGLEESTGGTIAIGERVVDHVAPKDRDVAMVFQSYALYPHMTVRQNLELGLKLRRTPKPERARRVVEAARILGIEPLLERRPREMSGGQRQRVALGRAIVRKPAVFLFDEPLSNLDAKLRVQMRAELAKLHQRLGTTIVHVTHDQVEAMTLGDRIAVLDAGRVQQVGPPLEVYEQPANLFVAGFLGTPPMNLLAARLSDGGAVLAGDGFRLPVPARHAAEAARRAGAEVVVGLRPEHLSRPRSAASAEPAPQLELTLEIVETLGHDAIAYGRVGGALVAATLGPHFQAAAGDRMTLSVDLAAMHLFDPASGRRWLPERAA